MISNGKGLCNYCKRVIMINEYTEKIETGNDYLCCVKCHCNIVKLNQRWSYFDNGEWKSYTWHEIQLRSLLENKEFEDIVKDLTKYYHKRCNHCKRLIDVKEIEYPEQIMEYEQGWIVRCWPCGCKSDPDAAERHKQIIKELAERDPCGC